MKYAFIIPLGMVIGLRVGQWLTGYTIPDKINGDVSLLVLLGFVAAGGAVAAMFVSRLVVHPWWDRRKK
jgi:hypothetical protein